MATFQISDEVLAASGRGCRVCISSERTDPADTMLFHKTTHRPLYARAFEQTVHDGFDDVIFLNQREELTEGAISNIFIVKDMADGLLRLRCAACCPASFAAHLLETRLDIAERVLTLNDLPFCRGHLSCQRGPRFAARVEIDWTQS